MFGCDAVCVLSVLFTTRVSAGAQEKAFQLHSGLESGWNSRGTSQTLQCDIGIFKLELCKKVTSQSKTRTLRGTLVNLAKIAGYVKAIRSVGTDHTNEINGILTLL
jgi:hypothetical protein